MTKDKLKERIEHRIKRIGRLLEQYKDINLSQHGYWGKGYLTGQLSILDDMLCYIENLEE